MFQDANFMQSGTLEGREPIGGSTTVVCIFTSSGKISRIMVH